MESDLRIAVIGAGLVGQRHVARVLESPGLTLIAIVDPDARARELAGASGTAWYPDVSALLRAERPDGIVVATPNRLHVPVGLECVAAGIPLLVEKPLADDLPSGRRLVEAAEAARVPLLVGHHRRHDRSLQEARAIIESGRLGRVTVVNAMAWFLKPGAYFDVTWRRDAGGGPILINLIHLVDDLRYLCGEIEQTQAVGSNARRGFPVEDTAVAMVVFANGALGTISVSDTVAAPWSWELTAGENPAYPQTDQSCYHIGGTEGSLSVPSLEVWHYEDEPGWQAPIARTPAVAARDDALAVQMQHFAQVVRGDEVPVVDGREALRTLEVTLEIARSAGETLEPTSG